MKLRIANYELRICRRGDVAGSPHAGPPGSGFEIRNSKFARAFTLIEVMMAIVIFALVMAAIYSTWDLIIRASRVSQKAAARVQRERVAVHTIEDSLTCIQSFQASMKYYSFIVSEDPPVLEFTSRLPDNFPRNGKFGDFNVRRLQFTLTPGENSEKDLVLRQKPILLDLDEEEQKHPLVLARDVQTFKVECWDTNQMEWATEWDDTNAIPPLIRVKLVLGGENSGSDTKVAPLTVTRVIAVPSQTMPAIVQMGGGGGPGAGGGGLPGIPPTLPNRGGPNRGGNPANNQNLPHNLPNGLRGINRAR
ncbi:MAG TPA: prepilin-type N-terminal cleavage/methylation domain-containing protein [Verrucomicrobiae bacterium]|nr:prepilin-type N-terminal cleavage/methylation domain-containing protein [Verrucomicrobiae bacterium]